METATKAHFAKDYQTHLQHLKLKGLRPKTIEAYRLDAVNFRNRQRRRQVR